MNKGSKDEDYEVWYNHYPVKTREPIKAKDCKDCQLGQEPDSDISYDCDNIDESMSEENPEERRRRDFERSENMATYQHRDDSETESYDSEEWHTKDDRGFGHYVWVPWGPGEPKHKKNKKI